MTVQGLPKGWRTGEYEQRQAAVAHLPRRVQVLYAVVAAEKVLPTFEAIYPKDERPRAAIKAAIGFVLNPTATTRAEAEAEAAWAAAAGTARAKEDLWPWLFRVYERAMGPGVEFDPAWRTADTLALAKSIFEDWAVERLPILGDALGEVGAPYESLTQLYDPEGATICDWWVWNLLGL